MSFFLSVPTFNRTTNSFDEMRFARGSKEMPVIISVHSRPFETRGRSIRANFLLAVAFGAFILFLQRRASFPLERRRKWERKIEREKESPTGLNRRMRVFRQAEEAGIRSPVVVDIDRRSSYQLARGTVDGGGSGVSNGSLRSGSCCSITHHQTVSQHYVARRSFPLPPLPLGRSRACPLLSSR